jgi:hypothetical protein
MGFSIDDKRRVIPPPPLDPKNKDEKDWLGLPAYWSLLGESDEERKARTLAVERVVKEAFTTVTNHLGNDDARRLFREVSNKPSKQGKQEDKELNSEILKLYDSEVQAGRDPKSIPAILARQLHDGNLHYRNAKGKVTHFRSQAVKSTETRVRRLVKEREKQAEALATADAERMKMFL